MIRHLIFKLFLKLGIPVQRKTLILISLHEFRNIISTMERQAEKLEVGDYIGFTNIGEESDGLYFRITRKYPDLKKVRNVDVFKDHGFQG